MKKYSLITLMVFLTGMLVFNACENDFDDTRTEDSILPEQLTVEIPSSLSRDLSVKKSSQVDTL
ncbi:MAG: hypothetical protein ACQERV_15465, partial [Bacteroidota bacterium]